jgi:hypothetical protein
MSPSNFERIANEQPQYRQFLQLIQKWLQANKGRSIDPRRLAKALPSIEPVTLASGLQLLVQAGVLRQVFKVLAPSGSLTDQEFEDLTTIPEQLPDRFQHYFPTADADIVPVFKQRE